MSGGMKYDDFKELTKSIKGLAKDYENFLGEFLTEQGMKCLANTKRRTPVDTGLLRNSWKLSGPYKNGDERYVVIHNGLNYASFVEEGHRIINNSGKVRVTSGRGKKKKTSTVQVAPFVKWKEGKHMARISLVEVQNKLPARFETAFKNFCKGKGLG